MKIKTVKTPIIIDLISVYQAQSSGQKDSKKNAKYAKTASEFVKSPIHINDDEHMIIIKLTRC